jgi:hypothetical protein
MAPFRQIQYIRLPIILYFIPLCFLIVGLSLVTRLTQMNRRVQIPFCQ